MPNYRDKSVSKRVKAGVISQNPEKRGYFYVKTLKYKDLMKFIGGCAGFQNQSFNNTLFYQHFLGKLLVSEKSKTTSHPSGTQNFIIHAQFFKNDAQFYYISGNSS